MNVTIRRATEADADRINAQLFQVAEIHAAGRPDIFKSGAKKYTDSELIDIINNDATPIFVAVDGGGVVVGYAFCQYKRTRDSNILCDGDSLYIDDLCVDSSARSNYIGTSLYEYVLGVARDNGCARVTLNVWSFNESAMKFYQKLGMKPLKTEMEQIL